MIDVMGSMRRAIRLCNERPPPLPNGEHQDGPRKLNEHIAVWATRKFGTMWTVYLFALYGLIPLVWASLTNVVLYWSNWVQLFSVPLVMVGSAVIGRVTERRIFEIHAALKHELEMEREQLRQLKLILDQLRTMQHVEMAKIDTIADIAQATIEEVRISE